MGEALKNGELIHFLPEIPEGANAICFNCSSYLDSPIKLLWLNKDEIDVEKERRDTVNLYAVHTEKMMTERGEIRKSRGIITNSIANFIGHL